MIGTRLRSADNCDRATVARSVPWQPLQPREISDTSCCRDSKRFAEPDINCNSRDDQIESLLFAASRARLGTHLQHAIPACRPEKSLYPPVCQHLAICAHSAAREKPLRKRCHRCFLRAQHTQYQRLLDISGENMPTTARFRWPRLRSIKAKLVLPIEDARENNQIVRCRPEVFHLTPQIRWSAPSAPSDGLPSPESCRAELRPRA